MKTDRSNEIYSLYKQGKTYEELSEQFSICKDSVQNIVIIERKKHGIFSKGTHKTKEEKKQICFEYVEEKKSYEQLAEKFKIHKDSVRRILVEEKVSLRNNINNKKGITEELKQQIINLYVNEKRGAEYIGKLFGRSDGTIVYWLEKWKIPLWTRSEISKKIREVYGPVHGFEGHTHTKEERQKISDGGKRAWEKEGRLPIIGKSRTIRTIYGTVQGSWELAYLQKLINEKKEIPKPHKRGIKTPFGIYFPDFENDKELIEIKSDFTLDVAKGILPLAGGKCDDTQWRKIQWVNDNVKKVNVIVLDNKEAEQLRRQAIEEKILILDNITRKDNKYFIN